MCVVRERESVRVCEFVCCVLVGRETETERERVRVYVYSCVLEIERRIEAHWFM